MNNLNVPFLTPEEINHFLEIAQASPRRRHTKLIHKPGDEFNRAFNFMLEDSYMKPHFHPSAEKIEQIHIIDGKIAVLFFDEKGAINNCTVLEKTGIKVINVPAFTWHTYIILTNNAITYETMMGVYDQHTWKTFAEWAPDELTHQSSNYLKSLKLLSNSHI